MKKLQKILYGDPLLRQVARRISKKEILSKDTQKLISAMFEFIQNEKFGVGLAALQVGRGVAVTVIAIKPTPTRPNLEVFNKVLINPEIIETFGDKVAKWEACLSFGGDKDDFPYGQAMRYKKIKIKYLVENAKPHEEIIDGFLANVAQHKIDHLNGILFVDRVVDNKTLMMASEFRKHILPTLK